MSALVSILGTLLPAVSFEGLTVAALHPAFTAIAADLATGKSPGEAGSAARIRNIPSEMSGTR